MASNTKAIGVAYSDQGLQDGTMSGYTVTSGTASGIALTAGSKVGVSSTDTVVFFGGTATAQPTSSNEAAAISTAPISISATQWAFTSSAQAASIITLVNQLRADLVSLGLIKGS